ncbi:MAG: hypothetical protein GXP58_05885 [Deltaproteobacteria bacterium]|nr:hypothetical protein [Deltaproteobacteria bacterium]
MKRILLMTGCVIFWMVSVAAAAEISVKPMYWKPDLNAEAKIQKSSVGEKVDFVNELGLDNESIPGITVDLKLGRSQHFLLSYWSVGYDNHNQNLKTKVRFNGETFSVGTKVSTTLDLDALGAGYAFDLLQSESFRAGFILNVNYYSIYAKLKSSMTSTDNKANLVLPMPGIRLGAGFLQNKVELTGQLTGLWWKGSGFWDGNVELSYRPINNLSFALGYRAIHFDISDNGDRANVKLEGPSVSATLRF